jgi:alkylation response protein AidB-like acyl-CoA dehydrogenase
MGSLALCVATEELSRACGGIAVSYAANALGAMPILLFGTEEQKQKFLPPLASGEKLCAFALTESEAGSDAAGIKTRAVLDGDHYVLNGTKQWITNGGEAQVYTVIAMTDPTRGARGATAFIVEEGTPGLSYGKKEDKMGIRASSTRELVFEDCRVPARNLISREGMGFMVAMKTLDNSRPGVAAQAIGIAQGALDEALVYASGRRQFGQRIDSFQGIQFMLADMATSIEAARALTLEFLYRIANLNERLFREPGQSDVPDAGFEHEMRCQGWNIDHGAFYGEVERVFDPGPDNLEGHHRSPRAPDEAHGLVGGHSLGGGTVYRDYRVAGPHAGAVGRGALDG